MSIGAMISIMTILSTVQTSHVHFCRHCILSDWGTLNILIPSVWSLKEVGERKHLTLWGDKSLSSRLRYQLRTLWDGVEGKSSRRGSNAGLGVAILLTLALLPMLACHYSSPTLERKGLVYHGLKILEVTGFQSIGKYIIQIVLETLMLLLISVHVIGSVVGKLREMTDILTHHHGSFL
jgi:hypothetical protein